MVMRNLRLCHPELAKDLPFCHPEAKPKDLNKKIEYYNITRVYIKMSD
jgi:hypothetical protein